MVRRSNLGYICVDQTRLWRGTLEDSGVEIRRSDPGTRGLGARDLDHRLPGREAGGRLLPQDPRRLRRPAPRGSPPYCRRAGLTEPAELTARRLNALSAGLLDGSGTRSGRPLSKASVASYARTINAFLGWLAKQGEAQGARMQKPKLPERVIETLSREDIRALEDAASTERDRLIIRILADTGVRLDELLGLKADSVRLEPGRKWYLKVLGKGDKERMVPILPGLANRIDRYAKRTRKDSPATCSSWAAGGAPGRASTSRSPSWGPSR